MIDKSYEHPPRRIWPYFALLILLLLGTSAGLWYANRARIYSLTADGPILNWSTEAEKEKAANLLNTTVTVDGFKAEVYHVRKGDNYWLVAKHYKSNIGTVLAFNPELEGFDARLGESLLMANARGALHQVKAGDTFDTIAALYGVKAEDIRKGNRVGWTGLKPLEVLFIPDGSPKELGPKLNELYQERSILRAPLSGRYTSLMGMRTDPFTGDAKFHNGVDIEAHFNTPVEAAAAGTVILAGWNGGFGKCIKIDHHNGYVTLYGHLNAILVHVGQKVKQFQVIAKVGMTGRTTGPHLHFTVLCSARIVILNFPIRLKSASSP
jgi:LysM repeat protein